jgi:hypothetical protein
MRTGVTLFVTSADLDRLRALVKDRNAPQKHVWRAQIVLMSAKDASRIRKNPDIAARLRSFAYNLIRASGDDNIATHVIKLLST